MKFKDLKTGDRFECYGTTYMRMRGGLAVHLDGDWIGDYRNFKEEFPVTPLDGPEPWQPARGNWMINAFGVAREMTDNRYGEITDLHKVGATHKYKHQAELDGDERVRTERLRAWVWAHEENPHDGTHYVFFDHSYQGWSYSLNIPCVYHPGRVCMSEDLANRTIDALESGYLRL